MRYVHASRQLAACTVLAALLNAMPSVVHVLRAWRTAEAPDCAPWVYAGLAVSGLQLAYAVYVWQLPDWSTVRVAALATLGFAAGYALLASAAFLGGDESDFLINVGLAGDLASPHVAGWSTGILIVYGLLASRLGQLSSRWHRAWARRVDASGAN